MLGWLLAEFPVDPLPVMLLPLEKGGRTDASL